MFQLDALCKCKSCGKNFRLMGKTMQAILVVRCPFCGSTNVSKLPISSSLGGIAYVKKFRCLNCQGKFAVKLGDMPRYCPYCGGSIVRTL